VITDPISLYFEQISAFFPVVNRIFWSAAKAMIIAELGLSKAVCTGELFPLGYTSAIHC
jgi:hypothetical protein